MLGLLVVCRVLVVIARLGAGVVEGRSGSCEHCCGRAWSLVAAGLLGEETGMEAKGRANVERERHLGVDYRHGHLHRRRR